VLGALLAAALQVGCGATEPRSDRVAADTTVRASAPPAPRPTSAPAMARAALLQRDVLGSEWEVDARAPPVPCRTVDPWRGATVKVSSPLLKRESVAVQQTIAVLPTPAQARKVARLLRSRPAQICFERALKVEITARRGIANFGPMVLVRDEGRGQRSTISSEAEWGEVLTTIDEIRTLAGRLIADTVVISGPEPIRDALYESLLSVMTRRLRDATGDSGSGAGGGSS